MISQEVQKLLHDLEFVSSEYYLKNNLKSKYIPYDEQSKKVVSYFFKVHEKKIEHFFSQDWIKESLKNKIEATRSTTKPLNKGINIDFLAEKSALYFRQGLEFLRTSVNMPDNTAPLVEYYGFLQCAKAKIIISLDFNENLFFTKHGIIIQKYSSESSKKVSQYLNGRIKPCGVLPLLIIAETQYYAEEKIFEMDKYLGRNYCPSLEEMLDQKHVGPIEAFIVSWMLSTLVRYQPKKWVDICSGKHNDFGLKISSLRKREIPRAISTMLGVYNYSSY
ncbi:hypothetical protein ES705_37889 [subsurface metagenome]